MNPRPLRGQPHMTNIRVIQYTTHAEAVAENTRLVTAVYDELAQKGPKAFRYATLLLNDRTFLHIVVTDDGPAPLPDLPAFQTFQRDLGSRVPTPPSRDEAVIVGSYKLF
jgi:hypothetical protein